MNVTKLLLIVAIFSMPIQSANASNLIKQLFVQECKHATESRDFKCSLDTSGAEPKMILIYKKPTDNDKVIYRQHLLTYRFLEAGGKNVEIRNLKNGARRSCTKIKNKLDITCGDWN